MQFIRIFLQPILRQIQFFLCFFVFLFLNLQEQQEETIYWNKMWLLLVHCGFTYVNRNRFQVVNQPVDATNRVSTVVSFGFVHIQKKKSQAIKINLFGLFDKLSVSSGSKRNDKNKYFSKKETLS